MNTFNFQSKFARTSAAGQLELRATETMPGKQKMITHTLGILTQIKKERLSLSFVIQLATAHCFVFGPHDGDIFMLTPIKQHIQPFFRVSWLSEIYSSIP